MWWWFISFWLHERACLNTRATITLSADCSPSSDFTGLFKSPKWRDGVHLWSKGQMNFDTALTDFSTRRFKTWMKKTAAQVNICLFLNVFFLSCLQYGAWKLEHLWKYRSSLLTYLQIQRHASLSNCSITQTVLNVNKKSVTQGDIAICNTRKACEPLSKSGVHLTNVAFPAKPRSRWW